MPLIALGSAAIGGYFSNRAAKKAAGAQKAAGELAYQRSLPWQTTGMFGGAYFDPETREATFELDPELEAQRQMLMGRAGETSEALAALESDPMAAAQQYAEQQKALYKPQQQADRLAMENRLLAQGMLGSTGGQARTGALLGTQQQKDLAVEANAVTQAQQMIDLLRGREAGDLQRSLALAELPMQYGQYGAGLGQGMSGAAGTAAGMQSQAAVGLAGAQAAQSAGLQKALGGYEMQDGWFGNMMGGDFSNLMQAKAPTPNTNTYNFGFSNPTGST